MSDKNVTLTPMMRQYLSIKEKYADSYLFFRMGDFYEMFFDDAVRAAKILNITLTRRGNHNGKPIPMCGVPFHSVNGYLSKMVNANQKVAICEQVEDPKTAKGVVKREVVRVITPGTVIDDSLLTSYKSNYLMSLCKDGANYGLSYVELSTGEFQVTELSDLSQVEREIARINPSEILIPKGLSDVIEDALFYKVNRDICFIQPDWIFEFKHSYSNLTEHFKIHSLDGFGLKDSIPGTRACGAILHYVTENCRFALNHLNSLTKYDLNNYISLDEATKRNLELLEVAQNKSGTSLLKVLDHTMTSIGARTLRKWIYSPLRQLAEIQERQDVVTELKDSFEQLVQLREILKETYDIERIIGRVVCQTASPRDLIGLKNSLLQLPVLQKLISDLNSSLFDKMNPFFGEFNDVTNLIEISIEETPPVSLKDGNYIRAGYNQELDELKDISKHAKEKIAFIQAEEITKTGIKKLRVKYNNVFGYYFEVSKGQVHLVPDYFTRKQTLVNAERYITPELKDLESKILGAEQKKVVIEQKLFTAICDQISGYATAIKNAASWTGVLDALASLAESSTKYDYVCPLVNDGDKIFIDSGRHPVVEQLLNEGEFISNDVKINCEEDQIILITGPNMAGKSTYIRQVALLTLMAQIGSHVPAKEMTAGIVDRIFTRVGAYDDLSGGKSTFMVEMNEMANILNNATSKSLIILDEIGRGTSTYDGISIAWAVIEYLSYQSNVRAKTLFATHYHELTSLEKDLSGLKNYNIAVKEWNDEIMFLHKIVEGAADKSYGIHVARLAGMPDDVIKRSKELLAQLEAQNVSDITIRSDVRNNNKSVIQSDIQMELFANSLAKEIPQDWVDFMENLSSLDALNMTPIQAIEKLNNLVLASKKLSN